jgi:dephospho-CoA kinase
MLRIGLTGGIGSGKSTVAKVFEVLGIPIYYADNEAKRLMNENKKLIKKIKQSFGKEAYTRGKLNRAYLSSIVFKDAEKLKLLNSIVHPVTIEDVKYWMVQQTATYVIKEAALIFESGANIGLDKIIGVYAPAPLRISRAMKRDNLTEEEVLSRMDRQMDEEKKMELCDYVIKNDEQEMVLPRVVALHKKLLAIKEE